MKLSKPPIVYALLVLLGAGCWWVGRSFVRYESRCHESVEFLPLKERESASCSWDQTMSKENTAPAGILVKCLCKP